MRTAGVRGLDIPSLEVLRLAEAPPAPVYALTGPHTPRPTQQQIAISAAALIADPAWHAARDRLTSRHDTARDANAEATLLSLMNWEQRRTRPTMVNAVEHNAGQRAAARWRPVLDALSEILDYADELIRDLALAALPEADLRDMADKDAKAWREALAVVHATAQRAPTPKERRAMCPAATLRGLRKQAAAARQHASALFGTVGKGAPYADAYSLARWRERQERAAAYAAGMVLQTSSGRTVSMTDVMAASRKAALARLYAVVKGMDEVAMREGLAAAFLTLTLPPEYHPNPVRAGQHYDPALSPRDADRALSQLIARLRARMAKAGIATFGLRVGEPHQDGCPHGHILAYMAEDDIARVDAMLQELRPEPVPGQRIATRCERIDRRRASPVTYVYKYLAKSLNASVAKSVEDNSEREDGDHLTNHCRVRAWASERGIRRWGLWGTHGVQRVWQALHQRGEMPEDAPESIRDAWRAIHEGRHADALDGLGAVRGSGRPRTRLTYEMVETAYGDTRAQPVGITVEGTGWTMPLKTGESRVVSRADLRLEQEQRAAEAEAKDRARQMQNWRNAWSRGERLPHPFAVTIVGSCPRAMPTQGAEAYPINRTGPPAPENVHFDDLTIH